MEDEMPKVVSAHPGWIALPAEHLPEPSMWPAVLALAVTFLAWGLVTSYIIIGVGILLFGAALFGWIGDIRHERRKH